MNRDWLPSHLAPLIEQSEVSKTVAVQAAVVNGEARWLLDLAAEYDFISGVVGWVDLTDPRVGYKLDELQKNPFFKGVRHAWEVEADLGWLARSKAVTGLKEVERRGLCYDFLVKPTNLKFVPRIMEQVPDIRAVIDHIAKPNISAREFEPWLTDLRMVAGIPGMRCKLSGMVTEAKRESWMNEDFVPYFHHVLGLFGADRIMFGSDWPVCTLAAKYEEVTNLAFLLTRDLNPEQKQKVFEGSAAEFYRL